MTCKPDEERGIVFSFAFGMLTSGPAQHIVHKQKEEVDSGQPDPTLLTPPPVPLSSVAKDGKQTRRKKDKLSLAYLLREQLETPRGPLFPTTTS